MKKQFIPSICVLAIAAFVAPAVSAKLPPPTPEAKAKAAEAAVKAAWTTKVGAYQLCQRQDQVVATYHASLTAAGKPVPAAVATPPCADPGPFASAAVPAAIDSKPIEASGAHSPAATAVTPPSSEQPAAMAAPTPKQ